MVTPISIKYTAPETLVYPSKSVDINLLYYDLARCDVYLKLEGVTIEKSNRATLILCAFFDGQCTQTNMLKWCDKFFVS